MSVIIKSGEASAEIAEKGAELKSLVLGGRELMWCADEKFWGKSSPVLFPMIGNLKNGKTVIDGNVYCIPKHGFARDNVFSVRKAAESTVTMSFSDTPQTKECYPFEFDFSLHYTLSKKKLEILYEVTNNSDAPMPFCIGTHPAFACPWGEYKFDDYRLVFEEKETASTPVMNLKTRVFQQNKRVWRLKNTNEFPLRYSLFDSDVIYFERLLSHSVTLFDPQEKGIRVSWEGFSSLGLWTPAEIQAPFLCIEAWCGCDDFDTDDGNFRNKQGIQTAMPKTPLYYVMTIEAVEE